MAIVKTVMLRVVEGDREDRQGDGLMTSKTVVAVHCHSQRPSDWSPTKISGEESLTSMHHIRHEFKKVKKSKRWSICIAPRSENLASKALRCGSHSFTCLQHHTCLYP